MYLARNARYFSTAGSFFHVGSMGSFRNALDTTPFALSSPAAVRVPATEVVELIMTVRGFQPISRILRMPCAVNFGDPAMKNASAPEPLRDTTWESTVGSLVSYDLAT